MSDTPSEPTDRSAAPSPARRWIILAIKVLALAGALAYVSTRVDWTDSVELPDGTLVRGTIENGFEPGIERVLITTEDAKREFAPGAWKPGTRRRGLRSAIDALDAGPLIGGLLAVALMYVVHALRWWVLMRTAGLRGSVLTAIRLTFVGYFSNNFMPGNAGGDVIKAVGIARLNRGAKMSAVTSVFVDRIVGLLGFVILGAIAAAIGYGTLPRISEPVWGWAALAGMALGALFFLWPVTAGRFNRLGSRLVGPKISERIAAWFGAYQQRPGRLLFGVLLALAAHACTITAFVLFGRDLGIEAPVMVYVFAVPVTLVAAALPVAPGGWGVREGFLLAVFPTAGVWAAQPSSVVLLSVLWGAANLFVSLLGGLGLLVGGGDEVDADQVATEVETTSLAS